MFLRFLDLGRILFQNGFIKNNKLFFSQMGYALVYHYPSYPTFKTSLKAKRIQLFENLHKTIDHYIFGKLKVLDVLPTNP